MSIDPLVPAIAQPTRIRVLASALDTVPDPMIVFDMEGATLFANKSAIALYGHAMNGVEGERVDNLLATRHPHGLSTIKRLLLAAGAWSGELYRRSAAGVELKVGVDWTLHYGDDGMPCFVVERSCDLARNEEIAEQVRIASHRYENIFQAMAASFWELDFSGVRRMFGELMQSGVTDFAHHLHHDDAFIETALRNTIVLDVNEKTVEMFGAESREAMIGGNVEAVWPRQSRGLFADALLYAIRREPRLSAETILTRLDGTPFNALFTVCWPPGHEGKGSVLVGVIDISDRKRSEAELVASETRYRELFQAMSMGLLHLDTRRLWQIFNRLKQEGVVDLRAHLEINPHLIQEAMEATVIAEVNTAAVALYGAASASDLVGRTVKGLWSPKGMRTFIRAVECGYNFLPGFEEETEQLRLDGTPVAVHLSFNPSPTLRAQGRLLVGLIDISERVAAESALAELKKSFAHHTRLALLGEMTASISHEINQPLSAIMTYGAAGRRMLERPAFDKDKLVVIQDNIIADARRAADVIARTRSMATGKQADKAIVTVASLVEASLRFVEHELKANSVRLETAFADANAATPIDPVQLQQVIVNLVVNAIQEMQKVPHARRVLTMRTQAVGDHVAIEVEDRGFGIPAEHQARLFDTFFTTKTTGLGMGLAICKQIVEAHGGKLTTENTGSGALFRVTLPGAI
ncbi:PAS domain S-box-containing protein [Rhizobium sp. SG_E_25_P2]|uniref:PAS domain-containing sensor histidine kinase n=1 Tax=Rhizobium sp. SG_E_25_P2 TaxID=2879942 RepID=UPI0024761C1F|nr:ATP-binding protein [Rhizobium sp. SG_E_25_P2]MDH6264841.1 PAS domain S-box-containing protein [Rhizobium sp. SG_E_25_P2]